METLSTPSIVILLRVIILAGIQKAKNNDKIVIECVQEKIIKIIV